MLNLDCIQNIITHSDYKLILKFMQTCTYFNSNQNKIWELICRTQYPSIYYFNFWTGSENYLVHKRKFFILAIDFDGLADISNFIYEYDPILIDFLYSNVDYLRLTLIKICIDKQFILIKHDTHISLIVGSYTTNIEAINIITDDQQTYIGTGVDFVYVIIDLEYVIPCMWRMKLINLNPKKRILEHFMLGHQIS